MKRLFAFAALCGAAFVAYGQLAGGFLTSLTWTPVSDPTASGYKLFFGTTPGSYTTNFTLVGITNASFLFRGQPGTVYHSVIRTYSVDGRESADSPVVSWTNPPLLSYPAAYRPAAIVYVP